MRNPETSPISHAEQAATEVPFGIFFEGKKLTGRERIAIDVLSRPQFNDLSNGQKMAIFEYNQFHDLGVAVIRRKKELFGEVREDYVDRVVSKVIYSNFLVEKYDEFYGKVAAEEEAQIQIKKSTKRRPSVEFARVKRLIPKAREKMYKAHPEIKRILSLKQKGITNKEISKALGINLKFIETAVRALIFFKEVPPSPSGKSQVDKQDKFLLQVAKLRLNRLGNREVARQLGVDVEKVEHAARFLLWIKLITPISKIEGGRTRWKRTEHKKEVREFLKSLDKNKRISLRAAHKDSGLSIGYDLFSSLYFELREEQNVPPVRNTPRKIKQQ